MGIKLSLSIWVVFILQSSNLYGEKGFSSVVTPFLQSHCFKCHGPEKQKADRRYDLLSHPIEDDEELLLFQDILDQLNLGEMPPEEEPRPDPNEVKEVVAWLTNAIADAQNKRESKNSETVLRRLNRREYLHTISDLFGLKIDAFDPTEGFPSDQEVHHLDNQGHALVTSGFLMDQYLKAADLVVEKALNTLDLPTSRKWIQNGNFEQGEFTGFISSVQKREFIDEPLKSMSWGMKGMTGTMSQEQLAKRRNYLTEKFEATLHDVENIPTHIRLYEHPRTQRHMGSYAYMSELSEGVPHDGYYFFAFDATGMNRVPPYEKKFAGTRTDEPFRLAVVPGNSEVGPLHLPQPLEPELAHFELVDGKRKKYHARIWLNRGQTPRLIFQNGSHHARIANIEAAKFLREKRGLPAFISGNDNLVYGLQHAKLPHVRIHHLFLNGPVIEDWPTPTQREILGGDTFKPMSVRFKLSDLLERVYRRPVTEKQVDAIHRVYLARTHKGIDSWQAFKDSIKASLCSPHFIYLQEQPNPETNKIDQFSIASRLSYFLWSSMPDRELLSLAKKGQLSNAATMRAQIKRMLLDSKSDRFVDGFLDAWLTLDSLGTTPPDHQRFKEYYIDHLAPAMRKETHVFFRHILDNNLPSSEFLTAPYTFVNSALARLYDLPVVKSDFPNPSSFIKVSTHGQPRGGLLGHSSIHTVTANGVDTSPIIRGVWLLENILGTPPPPPPPDIEPIEPDIRGSTTIRDQMEKHRSDPTCAECHRKIDPLGFALENFDAIGRFRTTYERRKTIDASGVLPGGKKFNDLSEFMRNFRNEHKKFTRALTNKLMEYSLGRQMGITDRPEIDRILKQVEKEKLGLRDLLVAIVESELFTNP